MLVSRIRRKAKTISEKIKKLLSQPRVKIPLRIFLVILITASVLLNIFTHVIPVVKYYGDGMSPCLEAGQILLLSKSKNISRGDIVAFYYNNKILVRRVIARGGDVLEIDRSGKVTLNGDLLDEPYVNKAAYGQVTVEFPFKVPANSIFVMGDNRQISIDSRMVEIGAVSEDRIMGKVLFSLVPPKAI